MTEKMIGGTYRIEKVIGEGGGGIVYKAYHERLRKYVVLKQIIAGSFASMSVRNEVDLLKSLKHTYLPQVIDFIEDNGKIYTVMDFIEGSDLAKYSSGKRLEAPEIIRISEQLLEAVDYLHSQKKPIIHSDIKPENIMVTPEGNICLIDFNISLLFENMSDAYFGTKGYAAPEQIGIYSSSDKSAKCIARPGSPKNNDNSGTEYYAEDSGTEYYSEADQIGKSPAVSGTEYYSESEKTEKLLYNSGTEYYSEENGTEYYTETDDPQIDRNKYAAPKTDSNDSKRVTVLSDIYSVGAVMYYMISGETPALDYKIKPLKKYKRNDLPEGLIIIAEKAMSFDPSGRYKSAGQMLNAVKNVMKLDRRYKGIQVRRAVISVLCLAGMAASGLAVKIGLETIAAEKEEKYYGYILEADKNIEEGDVENASTVIETAIEFMPEKPDSYYEEMKRLYKNGDYTGCINYYKINERLLGNADNKLSSNIFFVLANAYFETTDYNNSVNCFERALAFSPERTDCYRDLAISYARLGDVTDASDVLAKAFEVSDDQLYLVRGEIEMNRGNTGDALNFAEKTADSTDDGYIMFRALKLISDICGKTGEHQKAVELFEKYISKVSASYSDHASEMLAEHYTYLGTEADDTGYFAKAANIYRDLMSNPSFRYIAGKNCYELLSKTGDHKGCLDILGLMSDTYENDRWIMMSYAYTLISIQQALDNSERSYIEAYSFYLKAEELYAAELKNGTSDPNMDLLSQTFEQLRNGGWPLE